MPSFSVAECLSLDIELMYDGKKMQRKAISQYYLRLVKIPQSILSIRSKYLVYSQQ